MKPLQALASKKPVFISSYLPLFRGICYCKVMNNQEIVKNVRVNLSNGITIETQSLQSEKLKHLLDLIKIGEMFTLGPEFLHDENENKTYAINPQHVVSVSYNQTA